VGFQSSLSAASNLKWLRGAAKGAFGQIDRGEGMEFESMDDLAEYIDKIGEKVSQEIAAERRRD